MRILLLGANGQLGKTLSGKLAALGDVKACTRTETDLTDAASIRRTINSYQPDIIVNAAAYTAVDKAETERELAFQVNAEAVGVLSQEAAQRDIWLIHYSTDYVFDGSKTEPYSETDPPLPVNVYGESKLAGEQAVKNSGCKHLIFRTTWVIGPHGQNFARTILRLAKERPELNIINDQFGVPATPALIARVTADAISAISTGSAWPGGLYHLTPQGATSWFGIARTLLHLAAQKGVPLTAGQDAIHPIPTDAYPTPARRPANSLLNTGKLQQHISFDLPDWESEFLKVAEVIIEESKST